MRADHHIRGYTLIEALVAMTILAMSLTVLMRIFATGLQNVAVSADYARAVIVAETQLVAAGLDVELRQGQTEGSIDERFYWLRTIENYALSERSGDQEMPLSAFLVTVAVEWEHRGRTRRVSLNSVRLAAHADGAT